MNGDSNSRRSKTVPDTWFCRLLSMTVKIRTALATCAGLIAVTGLAGCAPAPSADTAEDLANQFVTWILDDVTPDGGREAIAEAVAEDPFPDMCPGALDKSLQYFTWIQNDNRITDTTLEKTEEDAYYFVVTVSWEGGPDVGHTMPVKVQTIDGKQCIAAAGEPAEV